MKKIALILIIAISLAGGAVAALSSPSYAQVFEYPPPPPDPYESPWVGPDTPWVYYNGDWFLDGTLYYFFGPEYGWAPYYAYSPSFIVRPETWYGPRWLTWYKVRPLYWESFHRQYPYWREHRQGQRYDQKFYEQHHGGQGGTWQKGFQRGPAASRPEGHKPGPAPVAPPEKKQPVLQHEQQPHLQKELKPQSQPQLQQQQKQQQKGDAKEKEKQKGHEQQQ